MLFCNVVTTVNYAFSPMMNKRLHAVLEKQPAPVEMTRCYTSAMMLLLSGNCCQEIVVPAVHLSLAQIDGSQKVLNLHYTLDMVGRSTKDVPHGL